MVLAVRPEVIELLPQVLMAMYSKLLQGVILITVLLTSAVAYTDLKAQQPVETALLFQTMTLFPEKISRIIFPDKFESRPEKIGILVKTDRKIAIVNSEKLTDYVLFDGKEIAKFQAFIYTNQGRTLSTKIFAYNYHSQTEKQDAVESRTQNQIIFITDLALGQTESINAIGFLCNKKITLLRVVWLDDFPK